MDKKQCRCCGKDYEYPPRKSLATRYYCDTCVRIEPNALKVIVGMQIALRKLEKRLETLQGGGEAAKPKPAAEKAVES